MFHKIKFINICPLCLGFVDLFSNYHLVVVCLGGNYSVQDLGAYCLGCTVWWKKLVDNWLGIFLGVRFGLDLYCWLWEIKKFVWALFGVKKRVICRSLLLIHICNLSNHITYLSNQIVPLPNQIIPLWNHIMIWFGRFSGCRKCSRSHRKWNFQKWMSPVISVSHKLPIRLQCQNHPRLPLRQPKCS